MRLFVSVPSSSSSFLLIRQPTRLVTLEAVVRRVGRRWAILLGFGELERRLCLPELVRLGQLVFRTRLQSSCGQQ